MACSHQPEPCSHLLFWCVLFVCLCLWPNSLLTDLGLTRWLVHTNLSSIHTCCSQIFGFDVMLKAYFKLGWFTPPCSCSHLQMACSHQPDHCSNLLFTDIWPPGSGRWYAPSPRRLGSLWSEGGGSSCGRLWCVLVVCLCVWPVSLLTYLWLLCDDKLSWFTPHWFLFTPADSLFTPTWAWNNGLIHTTWFLFTPADGLFTPTWVWNNRLIHTNLVLVHTFRWFVYTNLSLAWLAYSHQPASCSHLRMACSHQPEPCSHLLFTDLWLWCDARRLLQAVASRGQLGPRAQNGFPTRPQVYIDIDTDG